MKKKNRSIRPKSLNKPLTENQRDLLTEKALETRQPSSFWRDIFYGLVIAAAFLALTEILLRLAGIPSNPKNDDPFIEFSGSKNLFTVQDGIARISPERLKYFNDVSFPAKKSANTYRVFCFGGSTTYGHPFDANSSFPRWLGDLLNHSIADGRDTQVINLGGISYASYRIVPLINEALDYAPDLIVVYTGQNEFLERRTYSTYFDKGKLFLIESQLERLNLYRLMKQAYSNISKKKEMPSDITKPNQTDGSKGPKPVLQQEVSAILDRSSGLDLYFRDRAFNKQVADHFAYNIERMIRSCNDKGVPIIFIEPASNLKDFSPFKSEFSEHIIPKDRRRISEIIGTIASELGNGDIKQRKPVLKDLSEEDPEHAQIRFLFAKSLLTNGVLESARENFIKAKDLDVCPLRIPSHLEVELRRTTQDKGVALLPYKKRVEELAVAAGNVSGIPGNECFLDHVHPTIEGHQALAEMIFSHIVRQDLFHPAKTLDSSDIQSIFIEGMNRFDSKFFALRDLNLAKTLKWAGKAVEARSALERAAGNFPESAEIQKMLGSYFLEESKFKEAIKAYSSAVDLSGKDPQMVFSLAVAQSKSGNRLEAENLYSAILNSDPQIPEAYANLAILYLEQGRTTEAGTILDRGISQLRNAQALYSPRAIYYAITGDAVQALSWMQKAVEAEPGDPANYYNLAGIFVMMGRNEEAVSALETALKKGYANIGKIRTDAMLNPIRNTERFKAFMSNVTAE